MILDGGGDQDETKGSILTAAMMASLITTDAITEARPFSLRKDGDVFRTLRLFCTVNGVAVISSFLNQSAIAPMLQLHE